MATEKNFQATTPAAPASAKNAIWQVETSPSATDATTGQPVYKASCYLTDMIGDSGSGGQDGLVPAPPAGSAAALKFLKADGTWAIPAGGGGSGFVQEIPSGILNSVNLIFTLSFTPNPIASLVLFLNGVEQIPSVDYTLATATITYTVAPKSSDYMRAIYTH